MTGKIHSFNWTKNPFYTAGVLFLIAFLFRVYHLSQIPMMNDELSALYRLQVNDFTTLITQGVIPDGHPAFTQIFLYYYTKFFGFSSGIIKLPFIFFGALSVAVAYLYFSDFINKQTGFMVAALMLSGQFFIMHSQTARPYAFALFFILIAAYTWNLYGKKQLIKYFWFTVFIGLLIASTHYLAFLAFVFLIILSPLIYPSISLKHAVYLFGLIFLFYSPQFFIFYKHFAVGGVGTWLGKPDYSFMYSFLEYVSNYSSLLLFILFVGIFAGLVFIFISPIDKKLIYLLSVFILTFCVEFFYSIYRNPILQFPSLLFAIPFGLAFMLSAFSKVRYGLLFPVLLFAFQTYALLIQRNHYTNFYKQGYLAATQTILTNTTSNTPLLLNGNQQYYFDYYFKNKDYIPNYISTRIDSISVEHFSELVSSIQSDTIVVAHAFYLSPIYFETARLYFPKVIYHEQHLFNETMVLSKEDISKEKDFSNVKLSSKLKSFLIKPHEILRFTAVSNDSSNIGFTLYLLNLKDEIIAESKSIQLNGTKQYQIACIETPPKNYSQVVKIEASYFSQIGSKLPVNIKCEKGNGLLFSSILPLP
ncbi:MAG: glycosyltransferase family 39 protein [Bacteroidia bacterium]|nr:glycosyltransferase family 39 protein [Bacteroidia bacterium]